MRCKQLFLALLLPGCTGGDGAPGIGEGTAVAEAVSQIAPQDSVDYATPIVLLVSPGSEAIDSLKDALGEDFYVVADDAMWYRASALELLDSLNLSYAVTHARSATFLVQGQPRHVSWSDVTFAWFAVVYDGRTEPTISAFVDLHDVLIPKQPDP